MNQRALHRPAANPNLWKLDRSITFLNHGSFGACPKAVLQYQQELRARMESEPVSFFVRDLEKLQDDARVKLARFAGARPGNLVFVPNATAGVNTVLRSLELKRGEELLTTNHEYNACRNALNVAAEKQGVKVKTVSIPFPLSSPGEILEALLRGVTARTRLLLIDHVTSQTGLVLPLAQILQEMGRRGVEVLVDGAHAPGMLPLNLEKLRPAYYTGNCHKWISAPKGAAFLYVREDLQDRIRPLSISHGANSPRKDRSRFLIEFGWTGTSDPSAMLSVPEALRCMGSLLPGGWLEVMERNRQLALEGREVICRKLGVPPPCPAGMIGAIASIPLPDARSAAPSKSPLYLDPLQETLMARAKIEVPVIPWPEPPKRVLRISAQLYNSLPQYELLAEELSKAL